RQFECVPRSEIVDSTHSTHPRPVAQHRLEADQIGVVILLRPSLRQSRAGDIKTYPAQRLCLVTVFDTGKAGGQHALRTAEDAKIKLPAAGFVLERAIPGDALGNFGKALDPHSAM